MSVYFIRVGGYFKIGATNDPQLRLANLHKSGTRYTFPAAASLDPDDRELYKVVPGWKTEERAIHLALDDFSVGLEWFIDEPALRAFIDALPDEETSRRHPRVERPGGWCEDEYQAVQHGRAVRETNRMMQRRSAS